MVKSALAVQVAGVVINALVVTEVIARIPTVGNDKKFTYGFLVVRFIIYMLSKGTVMLDTLEPIYIH